MLLMTGKSKIASDRLMFRLRTKSKSWPFLNNKQLSQLHISWEHLFSLPKSYLTLIYMGFWLHRDIWGGAESARSKRMASEVNWGHWGYHQGQILFLTSFPICRTLEQPPVLHTLAVMDRRSHLVSSRKIISVSACEIPNFANFWAIWTIWVSNQSWKCSEFKFDMKKYNLLWKIWRKSAFLLNKFNNFSIYTVLGFGYFGILEN